MAHSTAEGFVPCALKLCCCCITAAAMRAVRLWRVDAISNFGGRRQSVLGLVAMIYQHTARAMRHACGQRVDIQYSVSFGCRLLKAPVPPVP